MDRQTWTLKLCCKFQTQGHLDEHCQINLLWVVRCRQWATLTKTKVEHYDVFAASEAADQVCNVEVQHLVENDYDECSGHDVAVVHVLLMLNGQKKLNQYLSYYCLP